MFQLAGILWLCAYVGLFLWTYAGWVLLVGTVLLALWLLWGAVQYILDTPNRREHREFMNKIYRGQLERQEWNRRTNRCV